MRSLRAAMLLAAAALALRREARRRCGRAPRLAGGACCGRTPQNARSGPHPLAVASSLDVLAVCLSAGMAVPTAAAATAPSWLTVVGADTLKRQPICWRWAPTRRSPGLRPLIPPIRRSTPCCDWPGGSSVSGVALADAVSTLAAQCRQDATHAAAATAERAGVLIAGPLGLCFLPAFVCLGIVPVIAGLAGDFLQSGLL